MTRSVRNAAGSSRMQTVLGLCIFLIGAVSFGPMMVTAWTQKQAVERDRNEAQAQPSFSMRWVVDPAQPGKVKLAGPSREPSDPAPDTAAAKP